MKLADLVAEFPLLVESKEGLKELRSLVLGLAVRGKLVPQMADDEPASVLLERIEAGKAKLVKESKLKKQKELPVIEKEEIPFEIPDSWVWCRLMTLAIKTGAGKTPTGGREVYQEVGIPFLRSQNVWNEGLDLVGVARISESIHESMINTEVKSKDLLMNITGASIGRCCIVDDIFETGNVSQHVCIIRLYDQELVHFIHKMLISEMIWSQVMDKQVGISREGLSKQKVDEFIIPLPPLAEQKRIVDKIETLFGQIDELESQLDAKATLDEHLHIGISQDIQSASTQEESKATWNIITHNFDTLFHTPSSIDTLKKHILSEAVRGRLIPQNPDDEPASVLLERIKAEKAKLVKEGKIKKQKPLPKIEEDEIPFEIPENWAWCRLGEVMYSINGDRGKNYPNREEYVESGIPWINTGHITSNGTLDVQSMNYITEEKFNSLRSGKIEINDLVYCLRGATFGKTAYVEPFKIGAIASSLMIIRAINPIHIHYLYRYLISDFSKRQLKMYDNGSAQPNLASSSVNLYLFPLPPLAEKKRIVSKIEELFAWCDVLKASLGEKEEVEKKLVTALGHEVLEGVG